MGFIFFKNPWFFFFLCLYAIIFICCLQDFIRNIWQNQSSQSPSVVPTGPLGLGGGSVNSSIARVYGSSSGHVNSNVYSSSQVSPGFGSAQPLDLMQEEGDRGSAQLRFFSWLFYLCDACKYSHISGYLTKNIHNSPPLNCSISSTHGSSDGVVQSAAEIGSIMSSFPPNVASPELHMAEAPTSTKVSCFNSSQSENWWCETGCWEIHLTWFQDLGTVVPPSSVTSGGEHMGTVLSEPFLTTGEALDKYQHLAQKVVRCFWFYVAIWALTIFPQIVEYLP